MANTLGSLLSQPGIIVAPGVFDLISVRLAANVGAKLLYMTGYGTVASHLGLPDAGIASYRDMVDRVAAMASVANSLGVPLVADGDTGYGGLVNVAHTVAGYEKAGAAAIQLEDQVFPKKCGHVLGRAVVPAEDMVDKIRVARDARQSDDFLIIARTDARTVHGLDEALRRMEAYSKAGADILFIESPESEAELERIGRSFDKPLLANMVEGGRTPLLSAERLAELGFKMAIFPAVGFLSVGQALDRAYRDLIANGVSPGPEAMYPFEDFTALMGFEEVWELEKRYARA